MKHWYVAAFVVLGFVPSMASAVDIKNIRLSYGLFGATRAKAECLPGDVIYITYDIEGLKLNDKTKKASYESTLELIEGNDPKGKVLFDERSQNDNVLLALGGTSLPSELAVRTGNTPPGKYQIKLTIYDKFGKDAKAFLYPFTVLPPNFGFIHVVAPAVGFSGQTYLMNVKLVEMTLDKKKQPNAEVKITVLDAQMKPVADPFTMVMPRDLGPGVDLDKANVVEIPYGFFLNRSGSFTMQVEATDKSSKKTATLSYPITVLDVSKFTSK